MKDILRVKHDLMKNKEPVKNNKMYIEFRPPTEEVNYYAGFEESTKNHKHNMASRKQDENELKKYTGGVKNTHAMGHLARQHYQEHARRNLEHQAKLHNLRLSTNPNFYRDEEKSDSSIYKKIETKFNNLISQIKNNNFSGSTVKFVFDIQEELLDKGFNLTSENLQEIKKNVSLCDDILNNSDAILDSLDTKDAGNYETVNDGLKNILKITQEYQPYANRGLRERKFAQQGIKINLQKTLFNEKKVLNDFGNTETKIENRLKYDANYQRIKELKAQEKLILQSGKKINDFLTKAIQRRKAQKETKEKIEDDIRFRDKILTICDRIIEDFRRNAENYNGHIESIDKSISTSAKKYDADIRELKETKAEIQARLTEAFEQSKSVVHQDYKDLPKGQKNLTVYSTHMTRLKDKYDLELQNLENETKEKLKSLRDAYEQKRIHLQSRLERFIIERHQNIDDAEEKIYKLLENSGFSADEIFESLRGMTEGLESPKTMDFYSLRLDSVNAKTPDARRQKALRQQDGNEDLEQGEEKLDVDDEEYSPVPYALEDEPVIEPEPAARLEDRRELQLGNRGRWITVEGMTLSDLKKIDISKEDKKEFLKSYGRPDYQLRSNQEDLVAFYEFLVSKGYLQ